MPVVVRRVLSDHTFAKNHTMMPEEIIKMILDEAFYIHKAIGPGMLETVYKNCLAYRLRERKLLIEIEKPIPVLFEEVRMDCGYRADLLVETKVIVEVKSIDTIAEIHIARTLTYLKFSNCKLGLIINFNVTVLKHGIRRVVNNL